MSPSPAPEDPEAAWCRAWTGQADQAAARRLYDTWLPRARHLALASCPGRSSEAEELVQELLAALFAGLPGYRGRAAFAAWAWALLWRRCQDYRRRQARFWQKLQRAGSEAALRRERLEAGQDPLALVLRAEQESALRRALENLAPEDARLLVLYEVEGLPVQALAELSGLKPNTVKSRLARSRQKLAAQLSGEAGP